MNTRIESKNFLGLVIHRRSDIAQVNKTILVGILKSQIASGAQMNVSTIDLPDDAMELAVMGPANACIERMSITRLAWDTLLEEGEVGVLKRDIKFGAQLQSALAAQLEVFKNDYEHAQCGTSWEDTWSCGCDDECPKCGTAVSPVESTAQRLLIQDSRGIWDLVAMERPDLKMAITMTMEPGQKKVLDDLDESVMTRAVGKTLDAHPDTTHDESNDPDEQPKPKRKMRA